MQVAAGAREDVPVDEGGREWGGGSQDGGVRTPWGWRCAVCLPGGSSFHTCLLQKSSKLEACVLRVKRQEELSWRERMEGSPDPNHKGDQS